MGSVNNDHVQQQTHDLSYEESTHDLRHRIHRDEHVDTSVNKYDDGDTEVTLLDSNGGHINNLGD